ncbi:TPA: hypothetical protein PR959_001625 [Staphylococcus aureus]|uniref:hypothetical protein n=1 Tax=Mammaliicoccus sciuri TaxID=1296 RepID=UPI00298AD43C|nr:hypothetical protein [Staphylococcus aureus]HDE8373986.1 hypothetical protein [Staphylococcus aureus]HDG4884474.1 hypothetical protein [Staphylococcus aureus]HDK3864946.1 hypothetical protein [Staphylococcus aureus]HEO8862718.1 hypothetical protein [Staphylococcus aureus]
MQKSPHGLKIDGRKNLSKNLSDNGLIEIKSENSGYVKTKKSAIKKIERKLEKTTEQSEISKLQTEIQKRKQQIYIYLNK